SPWKKSSRRWRNGSLRAPVPCRRKFWTRYPTTLLRSTIIICTARRSDPSDGPMSKTVFADTFYWLALARPRDPWHTSFREWALSHSSSEIVTTDEVLPEFLNARAGTGPLGGFYAVTPFRDV